MGWSVQEAEDLVPAATLKAVLNPQGTADLLVKLSSGEQGVFQFAASDLDTDTLTITVYSSNKLAPGESPGASRALAGSDWAVYQEIAITGAALEDVMQRIPISGDQWFAAACIMSGSTDTGVLSTTQSQDGTDSA